MFHSVSGDILLTRAECIIHGVAPGDDMKQGLALALRERWPAMYKDFRHHHHQDHPKQGSLFGWAGPEGRIVALFTQEAAPAHHAHPGKATVSNVNHALKAFAEYVEDEQIRSVAVPRLATGVGGLEWDDVRPLIEHHLRPLGIDVYIYDHYTPGQRAEEPRARA